MNIEKDSHNKLASNKHSLLSCRTSFWMLKDAIQLKKDLFFFVLGEWLLDEIKLYALPGEPVLGRQNQLEAFATFHGQEVTWEKSSVSFSFGQNNHQFERGFFISHQKSSYIYI